MDYRYLGPLEVLDDGEPIDVGSPQQRALLVILLLQANRVVATERILEDLWPDDPRGKERTLWVYISRLRATLDPGRAARGDDGVLVTRAPGYVLTVDLADVDAHRFEQLADRGRALLSKDHAAAAEVLREALGLWRGGALEEFAYRDFARVAVDRLEDRRLSAIEDLVDADLGLGRHREVIGELERLVAAHPERERFVGQLMIALYRAGRQADALRTFASYRRTIVEELGIEPSPEVRTIQEQVLLHDPHLQPTPTPRDELVATNPFVGLRAFGVDDADRFFGRDRLVHEVLGRIARGATLVVLVGGSGSGKSSVLHAGLVAALAKGAIDGSERWLMARMVPGSDPFMELEAALVRAAPDGPAGIDTLLADPEDGLLRACLRLLSDARPRALLVIDQFEELFTLGATRPQRDRFIRNLEVALDDPDGRVVVVLALRADFYGRPLEHPVFARLLAASIVNVVPLSPDELEAAAREPTTRVGAIIEPALLVRLLQDVGGQAGGLPLFQYALTELFDRRDGATLTHDSYREMGGVSGAVARRAETLFLQLEPPERDIAKQVFLRLVTIAEEGAWSRRRVTGREVATITEDLVALQTVLERFSAHRLLTLDRDPVAGSRTVEVAHEALLQEWPRLRDWIEESRTDVHTHARLLVALGEWETSDRRPGYLLTGQRLADYEAWAATSSLQLSAAERSFLDASVRQRETELAVEEERVERVTQLDRTARRRLRVLGAVGLVLLAALLGALAVAVVVDEPVIAVVHGAGGDLGAADLMIAGVGNAEREHGITVNLVEPLVDAEEDLRRLAETGTDLIIVSSDFDLPLNGVAGDYPDVHWVAVDPAAVHLRAANLSEMHFATADSAFLAGVAAALTSVTGRVGFVGGYQTFRTERSRSGFEQGVRWIDPDAVVTSIYVGPVVDPIAAAELRDDLASEAAAAMYADDVDVIFHDAGAAGIGVVRAARAAADRGREVWTIGSDTDEFLTLPAAVRDVVLTSTIKRFDRGVESAIAAWLGGELLDGDIVLGLAEGGVGLSRSGGGLAAIDGRLTNLEADLAFGHVTASPHPASAPAWQRQADITLALRALDEECSIEGLAVDGETLPAAEITTELRARRNDVVMVELHNSSGDIAGLALHDAAVGITTADLAAEHRAGTIPPPSLGVNHAITTASPGGITGAAAVVADSPLAVVCVHGVPDGTVLSSYPLIVRPT